MNIYFACTITGGRDFQPVYQALVQAMLADGHAVPTAGLAEASVAGEKSIPAAEVYARDVDWLNAADCVVAEVSAPSHGVGYEIGLALERQIPVLCLHQSSRNISKMISGNPDGKLRVRAYEDATEAVRLTRAFLSDLI